MYYAYIVSLDEYTDTIDILHVSKHIKCICFLESWTIFSHFFFVPLPTRAFFFHHRGGFFHHPCLEATTSVFGKSEVIQVYEGLAERQRRNEKTLSAAANVAIEAEEEARQEGQGDKRGFMGDLVTTKPFFFGGFLRRNKKENEASFGGAVARFVDGMWMNHAAKKTTYRDLRMEEGTPSWNKGKQLHFNEGNSLLQIHRVIIYSFTDPKMWFLVDIGRSD